jgi:hypothetical protein
LNGECSLSSTKHSSEINGRPRAIARDPELFPDPETFNPLRWVQPGYPTYKEPLSEYPTIINSTQFGYGRRICQGQTVADEDLLIGLGSVSWLFNISQKKRDDEVPITEPSAVTSSKKRDDESSTVTIPKKREGITMGLKLEVSGKHHGLTLEDIILSKYKYPGSSPTASGRPAKAVAAKITSSQEPGTKAMVEGKEKPKEKPKSKTTTVDPTLDFTTLLIAKPLPFEFDLRPRDKRREIIVRELYAQGAAKGEYQDSREYWGPNQGRDQPLGWGQV